ncbi:MAG: ClpXP protease specificity-enhancing factor, partial [Burkholderiaceae bacterium]
YLLRAIYEWCTDNGYTPYLAAMVDARTMVPMQFVKNGEIVLNISFAATSNLKMENDSIHFSARFGGVARDIMVPVDNVIALYARENGQGMAFEVPARFPARDEEPTERADTAAPADESPAADTAPDEPPEPPKKGGRPTLTRIK